METAWYHMGDRKMKDFSKATVSGYQTKFMDVEVDKLHSAEWNYKLDAPDEVREKFRNSIVVDGSIGVLAVRESAELPEGHFEVIDGNHRLEIIQELGWKTAHVENFGTLTVAHAGHISYRRNHEWFPKDDLKWAELLSEQIMPEFGDDFDALAQIVPDTAQELLETRNMFEFDWTQYEGPGHNDVEDRDADEDDNDGETPLETISYELPQEHAEIIKSCLSNLAEQLGAPEGIALAYLAYYSSTIDVSIIQRAFHTEMLKRFEKHGLEE